MKVIKGFIVGHQASEVPSERDSKATDVKFVNPSLSAVDDDLLKTSLTAAFMKSAEVTRKSTLRLTLLLWHCSFIANQVERARATWPLTTSTLTLKN